MEYYVKEGETDVPCRAPFPDELIDGANEMVLKENTKFRNIIGFVNRLFEDANCRRVIFKGVGEATAKCISCVEVFKRHYKDGALYQWNKIVFSRRTDTWKPLIPDLNKILIHVDVPTIFILISRDPFPDNYMSESCQSSLIRVVGFASDDSEARDEPKFKTRREKPKLRRLTEPNKWNRLPKRNSKTQRAPTEQPLGSVVTLPSEITLKS